MAESEHNQRIASKREKDCLSFMQTTSTNMATAKHYMKLASYDLERAVGIFYDTGAETIASDTEEEENTTTIPSSMMEEDTPVTTSEPAVVDKDVISSIMDSAKKETPPDVSSSNLFGGPGRSLNDNTNRNRDADSEGSPPAMRVRVVFYKEGFTAAVEEEKKETSNRRGVHSFGSTSSNNADDRLPPLRDYDSPTNKAFVEDIKKEHVPVEFRRIDKATRKPIPVSIFLSDQRERNYPIEEWEKQQQQQSSKISTFSGSGHTLGGTTSQSATSERDNRPVSNNSFIPWVIALLLSLLEFMKNIFLWIRTGFVESIAPPKKHVVDTTKEVTTISIRFPQASGRNPTRERVEFNIDHTVEDLRRWCELELRGLQKGDGYHPPKPFELVAGYPPRPIDGGATNNNKNRTLQEAALLNTAVEIRFLSTLEGKQKHS